jgi:hypothetical protein
MLGGNVKAYGLRLLKIKILYIKDNDSRQCESKLRDCQSISLLEQIGYVNYFSSCISKKQ